MKSYIGAKILKAEPMDRLTFLKTHMAGLSTGMGVDNAPGYAVFYPDGYVSWSPKAVFEEAYREISETEKRMVS